MRTRDLSQAQYEAKLRANGFESDGFLGYWRKSNGRGGYTAISELNCNGTRREKLAYILRQYALIQKGR